MELPVLIASFIHISSVRSIMTRLGIQTTHIWRANTHNYSIDFCLQLSHTRKSPICASGKRIQDKNQAIFRPRLWLIYQTTDWLSAATSNSALLIIQEISTELNARGRFLAPLVCSNVFYFISKLFFFHTFSLLHSSWLLSK